MHDAARAEDPAPAPPGPRLSTQARLAIGRVAVITAAWVTLALFTVCFDYATLHSPYSLGPSELFDLQQRLAINAIGATLAGLVGGTILVWVNSRWFPRRSFRFAMGVTALAYTATFALVVVVITAVNISTNLADQASAKGTLALALELILDASTVMYFLMWGAITLSTLFMLQVNDKFGPGLLARFLAGQYYRPRPEERIFMFLDLRSSTTIAERIGNERYFSLISDVFADITRTIIDSEGEIYQYVGDEVVVSWPVRKGVRNANFFRCFLQIQHTLSSLAPYYLDKYGVQPEMKAGLHHGPVIAGEVGIIKKDIVYSGDVLNTTARIQGRCNHYGVDLLLSRETMDLVADRVGLDVVHLGSIELRGKHTEVELVTVDLASAPAS